jgi:hypothetical protein
MCGRDEGRQGLHTKRTVFAVKHDKVEAGGGGRLNHFDPRNDDEHPEQLALAS